ncbi:hypothetical protein AXG93_3986s1090 [Marchantia polymorpha subsp. ruderalis]|uniref:Uncharacterized protein n=1 Tax=Marchantia polymorpha subsp. ruderalis TaxID=1480154 RepID=A0A176VQE6_MARPO|nr:hypothetical protein AXG93_3986s1090 [Marchantia polymorpha subsp. ruderalis]
MPNDANLAKRVFILTRTQMHNVSRAYASPPQPASRADSVQPYPMPDGPVPWERSWAIPVEVTGEMAKPESSEGYLPGIASKSGGVPHAWKLSA